MYVTIGNAYLTGATFKSHEPLRPILLSQEKNLEH